MKHTTQSEQRFAQFKSWLRNTTTGDRCHRYAAGRVMVLRNEFAPERDFSSTQAAVDHFAHLFTDTTRQSYPLL